MAEVSISAFAADFFYMKRDLEKIRKNGADSVHLDVMDGQFVPLFGFSQPWIRRMAEWDSMCGDVHLMTDFNAELLREFLKLPLTRLTLHVEAAGREELKGYLKEIRSVRMEAGLALSPWTEPEDLEDFFPYTDEILVMSCAPGTEGASFQENVYERIRRIRRMLDRTEMGNKCRIAVDGGLNEERAVSCVKNGAGRVIIGRAFFASEDRKGMVERVRKASSGNL